MAEFLDIQHPKFTYIYVPAAIEDDVELLTFEGSEGAFQSNLKARLTETQLSQSQKNTLEKSLLEDSNLKGADVANKFDMNSLTNTVMSTYQIIPLTVPTKANAHTCLNAYIDNVGRVKGLPTNARASRITTDDIKGDCYIVKSFDDEDDFKRLSLQMSDYDDLLAHPPEKAGRWDPENALKNLKGGGESVLKEVQAKQVESNKCSNCFCEKPDLLRCQRCKKVLYCSAECQKKDWQFHKRICAPPSQK